MRLKIEPPETKRVSQGTGASSRKQDTHILKLLMQDQALSNWCWAAVAASLGLYYRSGEWTQHEIASAILGCDCSHCPEKPTETCNTYAMLDDALQWVGCYSHWSPNRPTFERVCTEIDRERPICVCIDWCRGGSHYAAITGYYAATQEIYVQDSLHGPSVQPFDTFPNNYRMIGGIWATTYWTCPPAESDLSLDRLYPMTHCTHRDFLPLPQTAANPRQPHSLSTACRSLGSYPKSYPNERDSGENP